MVCPSAASEVLLPLAFVVDHSTLNGGFAVGSVMSSAKASLPPKPSVVGSSVRHSALSCEAQLLTHRFFTLAELARPYTCLVGSGDWPPWAYSFVTIDSISGGR